MANPSAAIPLHTVIRHEDDLLGLLVDRGVSAPSCWTSLRFAFLSKDAMALIENEVETRFSPRHSHQHGQRHPVPFPDDAVPLIARHLAWRSSNKRQQRFSVSPTGDFQTLHIDAADALGLGERAAPRLSYAFSVDQQGQSQVDRGFVFFIWLDPKKPLANNDVLRTLPAKYRENIRAWGRAYGILPTVLNGAACHAAVAEASTYPEFRHHLALKELVFERPATAVKGEGGRQTLVLDAPSSLSRELPLLLLYERLAAEGRWIECCDIARLAVLWLAGSTSVYLDTDMALSTHILDRSMLVMRSNSSHGAPITSGSAAPLLVLAQDADGVIQNNFLAVNTAHHPFVTLLLRAIMVAARSSEVGGEGHVIQATGPALYTAVYYAFAHTHLRHWSLSLKRLLARKKKEEEKAAASSPEDKSRSSSASPSLSSLTAPIPVSTLPDPVPIQAFPHLLTIPVVGDRVRMGVAAEKDAKKLQGGEHDHDHDNDGNASASPPPASLTYASTVHLLPPSAFFPRHWRPLAETPSGQASLVAQDASQTDSSSGSSGKAPGVPLRFGAMAEDVRTALSLVASDAVDAKLGPSSTAAGAAALPPLPRMSFGGPPLGFSLSLEAWKTPFFGAPLVIEPSKDDVKTLTSKLLMMAGVKDPAGDSPTNLFRQDTSLFPASGATPGDSGVIIRLGEHGWDCTWGTGAGGSGYGSAAGTAGGLPSAITAYSGAAAGDLFVHRGGYFSAGVAAAAYSYASAQAYGYAAATRGKLDSGGLLGYGYGYGYGGTILNSGRVLRTQAAGPGAGSSSADGEAAGAGESGDYLALTSSGVDDESKAAKAKRGLSYSSAASASSSHKDASKAASTEGKTSSAPPSPLLRSSSLYGKLDGDALREAILSSRALLPPSPAAAAPAPVLTSPSALVREFCGIEEENGSPSTEESPAARELSFLDEESSDDEEEALAAAKEESDDPELARMRAAHAVGKAVRRQLAFSRLWFVIASLVDDVTSTAGSTDRSGNSSSSSIRLAEPLRAHPSLQAAYLFDLERGKVRPHPNDIFGCSALALRVVRGMLKEGWLKVDHSGGHAASSAHVPATTPSPPPFPPSPSRR